MKFENKRILGIRLGRLLITEENQYIVIRKDEQYSLLNIKNDECMTFGVPIEHLEDILREDLKEHIKIVAKNII
ncbi:hypothetical protein BK708_21740 [Bacillus thuringiensis serovar yunnanensis]|nr:hypothetical protein BK708_21740 [Bacillus thuringiensis serovar yunnanensis]